MEYDDRPDEAKRLEIARKARGFRFAKDAATQFRWPYETYQQHEKGTRGLHRAAARYAKAFRVSEGWLLTGEGQGPANGIDLSLPSRLIKKLELLPQEDIDDVMDNLEGLTDRKLQKRNEQSE